jgi:hypothetical protein
MAHDDSVPISCKSILSGWLPTTPAEINLAFKSFMRETGAAKRLVVEKEDGLPAIYEEMISASLSSRFSSFSPQQREMGINGVRLGEKIYRLARRISGMTDLPFLTDYQDVESTHPYWDIGVQAFVVTAAQTTLERIAIMAATMAYFLHDVDDIADRFLIFVLMKLDWKEIESMRPEEFLKKYFPPNYHQLYRILMNKTKNVIPEFDEVAFGAAMMRMIRGSLLTHSEIPKTVRRRFQIMNKQEHILKLKLKGSSLEHFLREQIPIGLYAYTVKSLPDGILSFYGIDDPGLMALLGILTIPGLLYEDAADEMLSNELAYDAILPMKRISEIISSTETEFLNSIHRNDFLTEDLEKVKRIFLGYTDGFHPILGKAGLIDQQNRFIEKFLNH